MSICNKENKCFICICIWNLLLHFLHFHVCHETTCYPHHTSLTIHLFLLLAGISSFIFVFILVGFASVALFFSSMFFSPNILTWLVLIDGKLQALLCFFRAWFCTQREVEERTEKTVKGRRWGVLEEAVCHVGEWRLSFIGESQLRSCSAREGAFCAETSSSFIYLGFCSPIISILFWVFRRFQEVGFFFSPGFCSVSGLLVYLLGFLGLLADFTI